LYDILEVSANASPEIIRAAHERLSEKYPENSANPDAKLRASAIAEAFRTLDDPARRAQYDRTLIVRAQPVIYGVEAVDPFWTPAKLLILFAVIVILAGAYYKYSKQQARLEAEAAIAVAKAKEADEKAKSEAARQQFEQTMQQEEAMQAERQRLEREAALRQFEHQQQAARYESGISERSKEQKERMAMQQKQREEAAAAAAARQRLAQEKAELCRLERERYGRAISCSY
jgi:curved DNA-binding protein CbpA